MKKILFVLLMMLILTACTSVEPTPTPTEVPPTDTEVPPTLTPLPLALNLNADWQEYFNAELGYSFKYPAGCSFGPMAADCKQSPPEERRLECLCFLNAEDPYAVTMQAYLGSPEEELTLVPFMVQHHDTPAYNPPEGEEWIPWINQKWAYLAEDMPVEPNLTLGGLPAVRIYTPGSPQAASSENIFVFKDGKLIKIYLINLDEQGHRDFYERVLATFLFSE